MAKIISEERVLEYSKEFKVKIVELTFKLDVNATDIAQVMGGEVHISQPIKMHNKLL